MKKITETKTIEEVVGYMAFDGTTFKDSEECKTYENSAEGIIKARAKQYLIGETTVYGLMDEGSDENSVEIYTVPDEKAANAIAQLINYMTNEPIVLDTEIGKEIILRWTFDKDYVCINTLDEIIEMMKHNYKSAIEYYSKKNGETK